MKARAMVMATAVARVTAMLRQAMMMMMKSACLRTSMACLVGDYSAEPSRAPSRVPATKTTPTPMPTPPPQPIMTTTTTTTTMHSLG